MALRSTRAAVRVISKPDPSARPSRVAVRVPSKPDPSARPSRVAVRVISSYFNDPDLLRVTRVAVRVISENLPPAPDIVRRFYWTL